MRIEVFIHQGETAALTEIRDQLKKLLRQGEKISMTQDELITQLQADRDQIVKVATEVRSLLTKIEELLAQIANGEVKQEVADAAAEVKAQLQVVDDLVPDQA